MKKMSQTKVYYSVLTVCLLLVVGVSAAIYNYTAHQNSKVENQTTTSQTQPVSDEQANVTATGIPKTTETTTVTTTTPSELLPYKGEFITPTAGKVIKDFSNGEMVKSETMSDWRVHNGVDFSATEGEQVLAVQNGTVTAIDKDALWGVSIELTCPGNLKVKYSGLQDNVNVKKGDVVTKGDIIGVAGTLPIETAEGVHIHLETTVNDKTVNPIEAMNMM
ncbi:MAG: M23 family metallopeptidase [Clostridia bacterium]|nr:M23 family metallopeptidase [Clostridia bacterium]